MAALFGVGAALAVLSTPVGLVEMLAASSGMSEILPSAAPPLGLKARLLVALFAALMAVAATAALRRDPSGARTVYNGTGRKKGVQGARKMGFALSKLTALARARIGSPVHRDVPVLRRADAHPDAPSRPPIFASRDFVGLDIFARTEPGHRALVVKAEPKKDPIVPAMGLDMPSAPPPLPDDIFTQPVSTLFSAEPAEAAIRPSIGFGMPEPAQCDKEDSAVAVSPTPEPIVQSVAPEAIAPAPEIAPPSRVSELSVAELIERLERGLVARRHVVSPAPAGCVIADMPVAPPVPVREAVADDIDEALRTALGTLRTMTARGR
ncbi:hypothetical protein WG907_01855 [Sphingobium sp. AN558]|uniref:hypothetical protein n=1 Tax=Sphingobium sp. AN558 TaxID=3133442 RepID=UPI0030C62C42